MHARIMPTNFTYQFAAHSFIARVGEFIFEYICNLEAILIVDIEIVDLSLSGYILLLTHGRPNFRYILT